MTGQLNLFNMGFGEWISTEERLPEVDGTYLVVMKETREKGSLPGPDWTKRRNVRDYGTWYYIITTRYCSHHGERTVWSGYMDEILYWMPLPDFPEGLEEG